MPAETWIGVVLGALALLGNVANMRNNRLMQKDKLEFDAELARLKNQNEGQAVEMAALAAKVAACEERHRQRDAEDARTRAKVDAIQAEVRANGNGGK